MKKELCETQKFSEERRQGPDVGEGKNISMWTRGKFTTLLYNFSVFSASLLRIRLLGVITLLGTPLAAPSARRILIARIVVSLVPSLTLVAGIA